MGKLKIFESWEEKKNSFENQSHFKIDTKQQFDDWFSFYTSDIKEKKKTDFIYRGMGDARYKLYTSAQRTWIQNDMKEWNNPRKFLQFVNDLIQKSKDYPLIKKVFDLYKYSDEEREFPILSILQHYWASTPLMDWTYNLNVALFFATENIQGGNGAQDLQDYFSIYRIDKSKYRNEFLNIRDFASPGQKIEFEGQTFPIPDIPSFASFFDFGDASNNSNKNGIFYISDFDEGNAYGTTPNSFIQIIDGKAVTSIYNQNIIPQEGLFIFNPFSEKTIDDVFNVNLQKSGWNLQLTPFSCFNIKKDLADYIRRHIKMTYNIDKSFIYPHLYDDAKQIMNNVLNVYCN